MKRRRRPELGIEELQCYFDMPIAEAAAKLHLSINGLKKKCRKNGVSRWPYKEILATQRLQHKVDQCMRDVHISPVELRRLRALKDSLNRQERLWKQGIDPKSVAQPQQEVPVVDDTDSDAKEQDEPTDRAAAQRRRGSDTATSYETSTPVAKKSPTVAAAAAGPPIDPAVFRQLSTEHSAFLPFMALSCPSPSSSSESAQAYATAARTAVATAAAHSQFQELVAAADGLRISTVTPPGVPVYYPPPIHSAPFGVASAGFPVQLAAPELWPPSAALIFHPGAAPPPAPAHPATLQARLQHMAAMHRQALVERERARLFVYSQLPPPPPHYR